MRKILPALLLAPALAACGTRLYHTINDWSGPPHSGQVCMLEGTLPAGLKHKPLGGLQTYTHHYASTEMVLKGMADEARRAGAHAVTGIVAGQRFGYFAWKVVRPEATGYAVRLENPAELDCSKVGGTLR